MPAVMRATKCSIDFRLPEQLAVLRVEREDVGVAVAEVHGVSRGALACDGPTVMALRTIDPFSNDQ